MNSVHQQAAKGLCIYYVREWQSGACHRFKNVALICRIGRLPDPVPTLRSVIFLPLSFCLPLLGQTKKETERERQKDEAKGGEMEGRHRS